MLPTFSPSAIMKVAPSPAASAFWERNSGGEPNLCWRTCRYFGVCSISSMRWLIGVALAVFGLAALANHAGPFLVIDQPERSDLLIVLDGDENDQRYQRALELLQEGYGSEMVVDERSDLRKFGRTPVALEQEFIDRAAGPLRKNIRVCPTNAESTQEEAIAAAGCFPTSVS